MSAFHHYELLCDAPGCEATCNLGETTAHLTRRRAAQIGWSFRTIAPGDGRQWARNVDLCPDHAGGAATDPLPAGEPLPAVCVDEVWLPVEVMREVRDCLAERVRWFEARGRAVSAATLDAMRQVDLAIELAAGHSDSVAVSPRDSALARAAVRHADVIEQPEPAHGPDRHERIATTDEELHEAALAFARSLSKADRERLGR